MPTQETYLDQALTRAVIQHTGRNTYISMDVAPNFPHMQQSGKVWRQDKNKELAKVRDTKRAKGSAAKIVDFEVDSDITFFAEDHSLKAIVPDEDMEQAASVLTLKRNKAIPLAELILLEKEVDVVAQIVAGYTSTRTTAIAAGSEWDNYSNSDPIDQINDGITTVKAQSGILPNAIAMDESVLRAICNHPSYVDRVKHNGLADRGLTGTKEVRAQILAALLGLDKISVAYIDVRNTAAKGAAASLSAIWSDHCFLYVWEPNPIPEQGTANSLATVTYNSPTGRNGGIIRGVAVETGRDADRKGDAVWVHMYYDQILLGDATQAAPGHLFTNCLASV